MQCSPEFYFRQAVLSNIIKPKIHSEVISLSKSPINSKTYQHRSKSIPWTVPQRSTIKDLKLIPQTVPQRSTIKDLKLIPQTVPQRSTIKDLKLIPQTVP